MGKIKNTTKTEIQVNNNLIGEAEIQTYYYKNKPIIIDFSFQGAFASVKDNDFNSYLENEKDFIERFRNLLGDVTNLSKVSAYTLLSSSGYRHCHVIDNKHEPKTRSIIKKIFTSLGMSANAFDQELGEETFYQLGLQSEIRLFGTIHANVFKVYFIDYYHDFSYDQRRNSRNLKNCNYNVIKFEK